MILYVDYLNSLQKEIEIQIEFRPRKRLENDLVKGRLKGAIIGVNPLWFKDKNKNKYLWSSPIMLDQDLIAVRNGSLFPYAPPEDLEGRRMALPRGQYFKGVTERQHKGKISVFETDSDIQNLEMILKGRVEATIISSLALIYFSERHFETDSFQTLKIPHDQFERMILFPKEHKDAYSKLEKLIKQSLSDPRWITHLKQYGYPY